MEKNKLRLAVVLFLFVLSFTCIFAQEQTETNENGAKGAVNEEKVIGEADPPVLEKLNTMTEATEYVNIEKNEKITTTNASFANLPWEYIITDTLLILLAALIFIGYLSLRKLYIRTDNYKNIDEKIKNLEQKYSDIINRPYPSNIDDIRNKVEDMHVIRDKVTYIEKNISTLSNDISILGDLRELKSKVNTLYSSKRMAESITSGKLDVTEAFNSWATNPVEPLPEAFYYIEGDIKIRTKREIKGSAEETKWITNYNGTKQYLFPNPNSFNQMTNILELYKMNQAKLKGKGQNRIKIITLCEMTKDGFVEFVGELELL